MTNRDVDLQDHLGIDPDAVSDDVRARLEKFVSAREQRLTELRERALDAEQEASALQARVESLQEQVASLEERAGERDVQRVDLQPTTVLSSFGDALSSEDIQQSGFTVSDISVDLRANVVSTEEGIRLNLPEPGVEQATEGLSDIRFSVRSDPSAGELDLEEVPDLVGMREETATETLEDAGFEVGTVETVPADAEAGRVVDQLPSPFSLAEPGAAVDLDVAEEEQQEMVDIIGERLSNAVRFVGDRFSLRDIRSVPSDEPPGTVVDQDPEPGEVAAPSKDVELTISEYREPERARREREPGETVEEPEDEEAAAEGTEETAAEEAAGEGAAEEPTDEDRWEETTEAVDALVDHDVTEINGIGETYGQRLRNAGIESLADLAAAEPFEVADAANVSRDRATNWLEALRTRFDASRREREDSPEDESEPGEDAEDR